ncbi:CLUMA_CG007625, isoform A [Clunio marinus]|uniref:CLUMA_CG007625, isoform A n=1 Tax=Clunio marinus TaxID=568069 RepID=A0A1J1I5B0_9DIPT|nr:CLUMA_CG007625, isoform A [Clunio marinus]
MDYNRTRCFIPLFYFEDGLMLHHQGWKERKMRNKHNRCDNDRAENFLEHRLRNTKIDPFYLISNDDHTVIYRCRLSVLGQVDCWFSNLKLAPEAAKHQNHFTQQIM